MVPISAAPSDRSPSDDFDVVYAALTEHVLADAGARGRHDICLPHRDLVTAPLTAVPREVLMALPDREFVENCYLLLLDRPGSPREVKARVGELETGELVRQGLLDSLANSLEAARSRRTVTLV